MKRRLDVYMGVRGSCRAAPPHARQEPRTPVIPIMVPRVFSRARCSGDWMTPTPATIWTSHEFPPRRCDHRLVPERHPRGFVFPPLVAIPSFPRSSVGTPSSTLRVLAWKERVGNGETPEVVRSESAHPAEQAKTGSHGPPWEPGEVPRDDQECAKRASGLCSETSLRPSHPSHPLGFVFPPLAAIMSR